MKIMKNKTWPYGTTRRAKVLIAKMAPPSMTPAQFIKDENGEGHICIGEKTADFTAQDGDTGTLTFMAGGPTGGYWKFTKDPQPKET